MNVISLRTWRGSNYLSLTDILLTLEDRIVDLKWKTRIEEVAPGPGTQAIDSLPPNHLLSTPELLHLVSPSVQIIDGTLEGYDLSGQLQLRLQAVDSTWWDVEAEDSQSMQIIIGKFEDAVNWPR